MGVLAAICAYFFWGFSGVYFKALGAINAVEILSHRVIWCMVLVGAVLLYQGRWAATCAILRDRGKLLLFTITAILVSINWGLYIYSVNTGQALEASMGYFILPLVAVGFGAISFGERFSRTQGAAIALAACGVLYQIWVFGAVPWIALTLASTFGLYSMLRKKAPVDSLIGLFCETLILTPPALMFMGYLAYNGELGLFNSDWQIQGLLLLAGFMTAFPLGLFNYGAQRLRLSTVGLLQYINPTCQFIVAIFIFKEPFNHDQLMTFALIWAGLVLYSQNSFVMARRNKRQNT